MHRLLRLHYAVFTQAVGINTILRVADNNLLKISQTLPMAHDEIAIGKTIKS